MKLITTTFLLSSLIYGCLDFTEPEDIGDYKKRYLEHKQEFQELVVFFDEITKHIDKIWTVRLSLESDKVVNLEAINGNIRNYKHEIIGSKNLNINSSQMDSVLNFLKWDKSVLIDLITKLKRVPLDVISTSTIYGSPIKLFNNMEGSYAINYEYYVFSEDSNFDKLKKIHGNGLGNNGFDKRVFINVSSIL